MLGYKVKKVHSLDVLKGLKTRGSMDSSKLEEDTFNYFPEKVATFLKNSTCICCGIKAHEVRIEEGKGEHAIYGNLHLNVYAKHSTTYGEYWDLMTVDHDILKSLGGPDVQENFNTMCRKCNQLRGSRYPVLQDFLDIYQPKGENLIHRRAHSLYQYRLRKAETPEQRQARRAERLGSKAEVIDEYLKGLHASHLGAYRRHQKALKKELTI